MAAEPLPALAALEQWLDKRLSKGAQAWLAERRSRIREDGDFYLAFALAPRNLGKSDLHLSGEELQLAQSCCAGWNPRGWTLDQAGRITLLLRSEPEVFVRRLDKLCATGDLGEQVTLYQALPIYPDAASLTKRAAEGLRTNIIPIFEAVAHDNPYPRTFLGEAAWNQMVLKALFIGSRLHPIQGLDERANESLATTLIDYAHERWAAHRPASPELWRCVGPFLDASRLEDVIRARDSGEPMAREAAALALASSDLPAAEALLHADTPLASRVASGEVSWDFIDHELSAS